MIEGSVEENSMTSAQFKNSETTEEDTAFASRVLSLKYKSTSKVFSSLIFPIKDTDSSQIFALNAIELNETGVDESENVVSVVSVANPLLMTSSPAVPSSIDLIKFCNSPPRVNLTFKSLI